MSATAVAVRKSFTMPRMSGAKIVFSWIGLALIAFPVAMSFFLGPVIRAGERAALLPD
jgi:hypothetical protein